MPQDDYISYSKKFDDEDCTTSSKNLSVLEDKDDNSVAWRNSFGGTYRTKADSGPEISWMENSCGMTERKSRLSYESNPKMKEQFQRYVPEAISGILGTIKEAIGATNQDVIPNDVQRNMSYEFKFQSPSEPNFNWDKGGARTVRKKATDSMPVTNLKTNDFLAESYCIVDKNKELKKDIQDMHYQGQLRHPQSHRRFTFDETLRCGDPLGQPSDYQKGGGSKNIIEQNTNLKIDFEEKALIQDSDPGISKPTPTKKNNCL